MEDGKKAITEAIELINNRYLLVNAAVKRVKTLKKKVTFSEVESDGTFINRALQEIADGKVKVRNSAGNSVNPSSGGNGGDKSWAA